MLPEVEENNGEFELVNQQETALISEDQNQSAKVDKTDNIDPPA